MSMQPYDLTPEMVQARVDKIRAMANDDEAAHSAEDQLWENVLMAIADDKCSQAAICATIALQTRNIDFSRWCA